MIIGNASGQMDGSWISDGSDFLQPIGCLGFWYPGNHYIDWILKINLIFVTHFRYGRHWWIDSTFGMRRSHGNPSSLSQWRGPNHFKVLESWSQCSTDIRQSGTHAGRLDGRIGENYVDLNDPYSRRNAERFGSLVDEFISQIVDQSTTIN